jgi:hypothetical protein
MAEELKIPISVPGAKEATQDAAALAGAVAKVGDAQAGVANSAGAAAQPAKQLTEEQKKGTDAAHLLGAKNVQLMEVLSRLGPEGRIASEAISVLARGASGAAMALPLLGVAIAGLTMLLQSNAAASEEDRKAAESLQKQLLENAEAYREVADKANEAYLAEQRRKGLVTGPAPGAQAAREAAEAAGTLPVGKAAIEGAAAIAATTPEAESADDLRTIEMCLALGVGADASDIRTKRRLVQAYIRKRTPAGVAKEFATYSSGMTHGERAGAMADASGLRSGSTSEADRLRVLESAQGALGVGSVGDVDRSIGKDVLKILLTDRKINPRVAPEALPSIDAGVAARAHLQRILQDNPELGNIRFATEAGQIGYTGEGRMGGQGLYMPSLGQNQPGGTTLIQIVNGPSYQGGTHMHSQDAANSGQAVPVQGP